MTTPSRAASLASESLRRGARLTPDPRIAKMLDIEARLLILEDIFTHEGARR